MAKTKVDKNAPKKPKNAYVIFCEENMESVRTKNPDLKGKDVISKLASMWKEVDEKSKKSYEQKSQKDKERYAKQMESYTPPEPSSEETPTEGKKRAKKTKSASSTPKAPSGYLLFSKEKLGELKAANKAAGKKPQDIIKEVGAMWKALTDAQKKPYLDKASKLKEELQSSRTVVQETVSTSSDTKEEKKAVTKKSVAKASTTKDKASSTKASAVKEPVKAEPKKGKTAKKKVESEDEELEDE